MTGSGHQSREEVTEYRSTVVLRTDISHSFNEVRSNKGLYGKGRELGEDL